MKYFIFNGTIAYIQIVLFSQVLLLVKCYDWLGLGVANQHKKKKWMKFILKICPTYLQQDIIIFKLIHIQCKFFNRKSEILCAHFSKEFQIERD